MKKSFVNRMISYTLVVESLCDQLKIFVHLLSISQKKKSVKSKFNENLADCDKRNMQQTI